MSLLFLLRVTNWVRLPRILLTIIVVIISLIVIDFGCYESKALGHEVLRTFPLVLMGNLLLLLLFNHRGIFVLEEFQRTFSPLKASRMLGQLHSSLRQVHVSYDGLLVNVYG